MCDEVVQLLTAKVFNFAAIFTEEAAQINEKIERVDLNYDSESGTVYHSFSSLEDAFDYSQGRLPRGGVD
jgi:hypothetical protein